MGTYLRFEIKEKSKVEQANEIFLKHTDHYYLWSEEDRQIELKKLKEKGHGCPDFFKIGEGDFKVSGADEYMTRDFPPFEKAVLEIRKTISDFDFMRSEDVSDYLNNEQLLNIFGEQLVPHMKQLEQDRIDYEHDKKIIEESRTYKNKSVEVINKQETLKCQIQFTE